jgi:UDP-galactopyranose mutase
VTETPTVILGAGLCGLSAAYHLQRKQAGFILIEREAEAGGLARTERYGGFSFDHSIHILYTRDSYVTGLICDDLLAGNIGRQARESYCYTAGIYTEYPYQTNNYGLPPEIIVENLLGVIEANAAQKGVPLHFEDWIYRTFGLGIAERFMIPYNRRQWAWDLTDMNYDWIAERVPMPEIREVLLGALRPPSRKHGPNSEFWYPVEGGIEALARAFVRRIASERLWTGTCVTAIDCVRHEVELAGGKRVPFHRLISTLPLPATVRLMGEAVPEEIRRRAAALKNNIVHTVNIGFELDGAETRKKMHWVYFPEEDTIFHRVSFPGAFSTSMTPADCGSVQVEISESIHRPCDRKALVELALKDLQRVGILTSRNRVRVTGLVTLDPAYTIYDLKHRENTRIIRDFLYEANIDSRGRFGEWEYFNMDQAILSGKAAAETVP